MLSVAIIFSLCLGFSLKQGLAVNRDEDNRDGSFEFIYHSYHNLLLTMYHATTPDGLEVNACYFAHIEEGLKDQFTRYEQMMKNQVESFIRASFDNPLDEHLRVRQTSLSEMRDQYQDLLADFHCENKDVFTLELDYLACTFDHGLCAWTQSSTDDLDWMLHSGPTMTGSTGPSSDHTTRSVQGQYIYVEANSGSDSDKAVLISPSFNLTTPMCLRFWYFMYGSGVGSLQVYKLKPYDYVNNRYLDSAKLYDIVGDKGQSWLQAEVSVFPKESHGNIGESLQIGFRAIRGASIYGDIAVDDVTGTPGVCTSARIDCDFGTVGDDNGFCRWNQDGTENMDWRLNSGPTDTANTGPSGDHTANDSKGQYAYTEGNDGLVNDLASLISPVLYLEEPMCMSFWYFMKGSDVGSLSVYIKNLVADEEKLLWSRTGEQGDQWRRDQVIIMPIQPNEAEQTNEAQQIVIRATRGPSIESDVAIDDIKGSPGVCVN